MSGRIEESLGHAGVRLDASPDDHNPAPSRPRVHLRFLDGLRGLSALYVMLNHTSILAAAILYSSIDQFPPWLAKIYPLVYHGLLDYGAYGVCVFIVLSGYCLMLPAVRSPRQDLDGFWPFMKRRARRIMPPYYAVLAISLLVLLALPLVGLRMDELQAYKFLKDSFSAGSIISHLLLVHAVTPWHATIDAPMWTVSVEWGIYFFLPLLLLPLYRRSVPLMLIVALALGLAPTYLLNNRFEEAHLWFLFLFTLGATGAAISFGPRERFERIRKFRSWGGVTCIFALIAATTTLVQRVYFQRFAFLDWLRWDHWLSRWPQEFIVGFTAVAFIIYCAESARTRPGQSRIVAGLSSPSMHLLGAFSYSLYLAHAPALEVITALSIKHLTPVHAFYTLIFLGIPLTIGFCYLVYLAFERPFLRSERVRVADVVSPVSHATGS